MIQASLSDVPYVLGRITRRLLPETLARRYLTNDYDDLQHLAMIHECQLQAVAREAVDLTGKTVLEIGPGCYNPAVVGFLPGGAARAVLVESLRRQLDHGLMQQRMRDLMAAFGFGGAEARELTRLDPDETPRRTTFGQGRIEYRWQSAAATGLEDGSVDAIFSHSVLQCLAEPAETFAELARVLKPGGHMYHVVDLRDHFFRYPLQFLCYSDYIWSHVLTSRYPHKAYLNRLRLPQLQEMFEALGLEVTTSVREDDLNLARRMRPRLHRDFQRFTDEELAPLLADVNCRKPLRAQACPAEAGVKAVCPAT